MYSTVFTVESFLLCSQIQQYKAIKYDISPLSPISRHRLNMVRKKVRKSEILQKKNHPRYFQVLVLDLDETLIHSHHDGVVRPTVKPGTPPDFILKVCQISYSRFYGVKFILHISV